MSETLAIAPEVNSMPIEGFQLSPQQKRVWLLQGEVNDVFRSKAAVMIRGPLEVELLKGCVEKICQHHEILRTTFSNLPGMTVPVQVISEPTMEWRIQCLQNFSVDSDEAVAQKLFEDFVSHSDFDLESGPVLKFICFQLAAERHLLLIGLPALCADEVSLHNFIAELSRIYATGLEEPALTETMQYADFSAWQTDLLDSSESANGKNYWRKKEIASFLKLQLPLEIAAPDSQFLPQTKTLKYCADLWPALSVAAEKQKISPETFLLGVWQLLLGRLTSANEMLVGVRFDGRKYPELKEALGLYAKYLPVDCRWDEKTQFEKILAQLAETTNEARELQDCFSWGLFGNTQLSQSFPFLFEFNADSEDGLVGDTTFSLMQSEVCLERFKLKLHCQKSEDDFAIHLDYDASRFGSDEIERLAERFEALLHSALVKPESVATRLNVVGKDERQKLIHEFNRATTPLPNEKSVVELFEKQAMRTPDQHAVTCGNVSVSYAELNRRANGWAHELRRAGVGPEVPVGLCVERSIEMVVGILAILKSGGAYVPLDPSYPRERLAFMLEEIEAPVLLTQKKFEKLLPAGNAKKLFLDEPLASLDVNPQSAIQNPQSLAYVIFTSGSTGKAKGVQVTHGNLLRSTAARLSYYREPLKSYLLVSSFSFDSSVAGIFWTLAAGGTLVLPEEGLQQDPLELIRLIERNQVSHFLSLPSLYQLLLQEKKVERLASLRTVIVAGESCPKELVEQHCRILPSAALFNEYGPTEGTVWSSVAQLSSERPIEKITIGQPIPNAQIHLLDANREPVPLGVPGEIFVGGAGVARGYLKRPELTAEKFVPNPFTKEPDARLYRTGDLARWLPDGKLEFLGRIDHQVKIRGYRIELEEIESVLRQHPGVREAVVIARDDAPTTRRVPVTEDIDSLTEALSSLNEAEAQKLFDQMEKVPATEPTANTSSLVLEKQTDHRFQRFPEFEVSLEIKSPRFIQPPRETQRNWLLNRALKEFSDDLKGLDRVAKRFVRGTDYEVESLVSDRTQATLDAQQIMEDWHAPLMRAMARAVTETHGDILEIGFGRGISAGFLQECGVRSHTIIECNDFVIGNFFEPWKVCRRGRDIRLVRGKWQEVLDRLQTYDGIFFQTYPLNEKEFVEYLSKSVTFAEHFFPTAARLLKPGGVFTYLSHEIDSLSREHQRILFQHFSSIALSVERLKLPDDCKDLWWADSMVVVKAVK